MTDQKINTLWADALKYANPTAGNAHFIFARSLLAQPAHVPETDYGNIAQPEQATQPIKPSLLSIDELAVQYCTSYASPHHVTFSVEGLQRLIQAIAQPGQPAIEQNFCARCGKRLAGDGIHTCTPPKAQQ